MNVEGSLKQDKVLDFLKYLFYKVSLVFFLTAFFIPSFFTPDLKSSASLSHSNIFSNVVSFLWFQCHLFLWCIVNIYPVVGDPQFKLMLEVQFIKVLSVSVGKKEKN